MSLPLRRVVDQALVREVPRHSRGFHGRVYHDRVVRYDLECGHSVTLFRKAHGKGGGKVHDPALIPCPVCGPVESRP